MSLFVCAKCGCVDNTATSSYWMLTNEYMVDKFDYAKELQPYKGMGLCSECGRLESDELLQQKRKAYHLSDEGFEEYKKFLSDPDQKKFCFKGYYYVEVKEQDDKELLGAMGRVVYK